MAADKIITAQSQLLEIFRSLLQLIAILILRTLPSYSVCDFTLARVNTTSVLCSMFCHKGIYSLKCGKILFHCGLRRQRA